MVQWYDKLCIGVSGFMSRRALAGLHLMTLEISREHTCTVVTKMNSSALIFRYNGFAKKWLEYLCRGRLVSVGLTLGGYSLLSVMPHTCKAVLDILAMRLW